MKRVVKHIKKHALKAARVGRRVHHHLKKPVHAFISYWTMGLAAVCAVIIISAGMQAMAQTAENTPPIPNDAQLLSGSQQGQTQETMRPGEDFRQRMPASPEGAREGGTDGFGGQNFGGPRPCPEGQKCPPPSPNGPLPETGNFAPPCPEGRKCPPPQNRRAGQNEEGQNFPNQNNRENNSGPENRGPSDEQRLQQMQKGMGNFTREIARIKSQIKTLEKKGVSIPEDLTGTLAKLDSLTEKMKSAKSPEELDEVLPELQDAEGDLRDWMPKLGKLSQLGQMLKQADKEIARAAKQAAMDEKKITASKLDLSQSLSDFKAAIEKQNAILTEVRNLMKTDPEAAFDKLNEDFFGNMDNLWSPEKVIQVSLNIKKGLSQMDREIKSAEATVKKLSKKDGAGELSALLAAAKEQLAKIKELSAAKPMDTDAVINALEDLMRAKQDFADKVQDITGDNGVAVPAGQNFEFRPPQNFMTQQGGAG